MILKCKFAHIGKHSSHHRIEFDRVGVDTERFKQSTIGNDTNRTAVDVDVVAAAAAAAAAAAEFESFALIDLRMVIATATCRNNKARCGLF